MQLAQYRIVRRIGAGGMAEVFLAQKTGAAGFSRQVAIKTIIAAGTAQESIGLFLDEARVASNLQHANIVQTLDLGFENDTLFIAMEYVPGPPLSRVIKELKERGRLLPAPLVAYVGAKVANALDYAHRRVTTSQGQQLALVHRDISPQNILVSRTGIVKLMDFGVARASIQMHKTRTGQVRGKAAYMAPEQVRAQTLDGRTDMFALGLVLYEMLTAYRPFQRANEIASMRAIIAEDVPPLSARNPDVPRELEAAVMKCLRRVPDERFAHCGELEAALLETIRTHRMSSMEEELVRLLEELFGKEQFTDEMPEVEAWQPTMASMDTPATPRMNKVPGAGLSPDILAMIGQTPQTPAAPMAELLDVEPPRGTRGFTQPPQRTPPPPAFTQPPQRVPGPPAAYDPATGVVYDAQGTPIDPAALAELGRTPDRALTPGSLPSAANLRMTMASQGQMHGILSGTANALSPYSLSSVPGMTPASSPSITTSGPGHLKLVVAVLASFLAGICLMVLLRDDTSSTPMDPPPRGGSAHLGVSGPSPTPSGGASSAASPTLAERPRETDAAREGVGTPASAAPRESASPRGSAAPRESREPRDRPRESARPTPEAPTPTPAAPPALDRGKLTERALSLKAQAEAAGKTDLAKRLGSFLNDMLVGRDPTPADAELIRSAESALP